MYSNNIILNKHISGKHLSLKEGRALLENERQTIVIKNNEEIISIFSDLFKFWLCKIWGCRGA